jgi:phosphatidylserine/phosphatidylglycerophosphate/cardiolipin synthase-like enzyme
MPCTPIAHNKIMVIDDRTVLTGSFNFTKAAEDKNAENLLIIRDVKVAAGFERNWQAHFRHAEYHPGR